MPHKRTTSTVIRVYLRDTGLSAADLARYCALERSTVTRLIRGEREPDGTTALRILRGTKDLQRQGLVTLDPITVGALIPEFAGVA